MKVSLAHFGIAKCSRQVVAHTVLQEVTQIVARFCAVATQFVVYVQPAGKKNES